MIKDKNIAVAVYAAALHKLNEVRRACPSTRGDIEAFNLRHLIENGLLPVDVPITIEQSARTIEQLASGIHRAIPGLRVIDVMYEVAALRALIAPEDTVAFPPIEDPFSGRSVFHRHLPAQTVESLHRRLAILEERENKLAALFRELTLFEIKHRHASDAARVARASRRPGEPVRWSKDDPDVKAARAECIRVSTQIRRIRETNVS